MPAKKSKSKDKMETSPTKTAPSSSLAEGIQEVVIGDVPANNIEMANMPENNASMADNQQQEAPAEWNSILKEPTPLIEEKPVKYPDDPRPGEAFFVTSSTAESRPFNFPIRVDHFFPGQKFLFRGESRVPMPSYRAKDAGFQQFGDKPNMALVTPREEEMVKEIQHWQKFGVISKDEDEKRLLEVGFPLPRRTFLLKNFCTAPKATLNKVKIDTDAAIANNEHIFLGKPVNLACARSLWGFIPIVKEHVPHIGSKRDRSGVYAPRLSNYHPGVVACAAMHIDKTQDSATLARLPINAAAINFDKTSVVSLLGKLCHQSTVGWTEANTPNIWREIKTIDQTSELRISLSRTTLVMLQTIINAGDLRNLDYNEKPPRGKVDTWLEANDKLTEPRLAVLHDCTMTPAVALQLKTIANMGWLNLELNNEMHVRRWKQYQYEKQLEYIEYTCTVQALLINWLAEVLEACQAEFLHWRLIRLNYKCAVGWTSTAMGLGPLVEYLCCQEIHSEHPTTTPIGRLEHNQFMGLFEGQVQRLSLIQTVLIQIQRVQWHHAQCYSALFGANAAAFMNHDKCFMNAVFDLTNTCWKAYVAAKESGNLYTRAMNIQRRFEWLLPEGKFNPDKFVRPMPRMCLTRKTFAAYSTKEGFDASQWNTTPCNRWHETASPMLKEQQRRMREKTYGKAIEPKMEISNMNLEPTDDYRSSGEEFEDSFVTKTACPLDPSGHTWLKLPIAKPIEKPFERNVYERKQVIEMHFGEKAFVDMSFANEDMKDFQGKDKDKLTCAHFFFSANEHASFMNYIVSYKDQINKVVDAYDACFDVRNDLAIQYAALEAEIKNATKIVEEIQTLANPDNNTKTSESAHLIKFISPIVASIISNGISVEGIHWNKWAMRKNHDQRWSDLSNHCLGDILLHNLNIGYTILSQNFAYRRRDNTKYDLYRKALVIHADDIYPENRIYFEPVSELKMTTCSECKFDLTQSLHKTTCWMKAPHLPKAVIQFRENKVEYDPVSLLKKHLADAKDAQDAEVMEFMKDQKMEESVLAELAKQGHPAARRIIMKTPLGAAFAKSMPDRGRSRPLGTSGGFKRPFVQQNKFEVLAQREKLPSQESQLDDEEEVPLVEDENMDHVEDGDLNQSQVSETFKTVYGKRTKKDIKDSFRHSSSERGKPPGVFRGKVTNYAPRRTPSGSQHDSDRGGRGGHRGGRGRGNSKSRGFGTSYNF